MQYHNCLFFTMTGRTISRSLHKKIMLLPIIGYGAAILQQACIPAQPGTPVLNQLVTDMWDTLLNAGGAGLAAPQVNIPWQVFLVNSAAIYRNSSEADRRLFFEGDSGIQEAFINARITHYSTETCTDEEGCLSIPGVSAAVQRPCHIQVSYQNIHGQQLSGSFGGITARIIQHEYDHTQGVLYLRHLKQLNRQLLKNKLRLVASGKIKAAYPMRFIT